MRRCPFEHARDVVEDLAVTPRGILCLQEVSSGPLRVSDEFILPGWIAQHIADRRMGPQCMHSLVLLSIIGIIANYLPDSWKSLELYAKAIDELFVARDLLQQQSAQAFVIGGGIQVELKWNFDERTGQQALGRATSREYFERHQILITFMQLCALHAVNLFCVLSDNYKCVSY